MIKETMIKDSLVPEPNAASEAIEAAQLRRGRGISCRNQRGMVSAEWAVGIIAAVAVAGVLLGIVTSGPIHDALLDFILMVIRSFSDFIK